MNDSPAPKRMIAALAIVAVLAGCVGDAAAEAEVHGKTYGVGPVRSLRITEADLQYFGSVGRTNSEGLFLNREVLTIEDVDPETLLLVRAAPALQDDPDDPWGPYVGLWGGGEDADLCGYIDASAVTFCE